MADGDRGTPARRYGMPRSTAARMISALIAAVVLAGLASVAVPLVRAAVVSSDAVPLEAAATPTAPRGAVVVCLDTSDDDYYCGRYAANLGRRMPLTEHERLAGEEARDRVIAVLPEGELRSSCGRPEEPCSSTYWPPTVDQVRRALVEAGYGEIVVRLARADDPAPVGSVLIAVQVSSACVLMHIDRNSTPASVRGRQADGRCVKG